MVDMVMEITPGAVETLVEEGEVELDLESDSRVLPSTIKLVKNDSR